MSLLVNTQTSGNRVMKNHESAMQVYVRLAVVSDQKKQPQVRDRFLLLAGVEACRSGWPDVAACCQQRLVKSNPAHQIKRHHSFADALRDTDFQQLVVHWERYCPLENAEALLDNLHLPPLDFTGATIGEQMLKLLENGTQS